MARALLLALLVLPASRPAQATLPAPTAVQATAAGTAAATGAERICLTVFGRPVCFEF